MATSKGSNAMWLVIQIVVIGAVIWFVADYFIGGKMEDEETRNAFNEVIPKYPTPDDVRKQGSSDVSDNYIKGKAIIADLTKRNVSDLTFSLPAAIQATHPDDIGTFIWIEYTTEDEGAYSDGTPAVRTDCTVHVVDLAIPQIVAGKFFSGLPPPAQTSQEADEKTGTISGMVPTEGKIMRFLENLDRVAK